MNIYEFSHKQCCLDPKASIFFGLYLTCRQTNDELINKETIEDNGIGWNKPDSQMTDLFILLLEEYKKSGDIKITKDLIDFHIKKLSKVLVKYRKQYDDYLIEKPFIKPSNNQIELF